LPAGYTHINQDTLKTRNNCLAAAERAVMKGQKIVVDNTNRNRETRRYWIDLAERLQVPIRVFHFLCPVELAKHNNMYRAVYAPSGEAARELLPQVAFTSYAAAFERPDIKEGFDELRLVNFVWEGTDAQRRLWDMYMLETR
jgi:bifunctional polynucleotide phosphatase/kinase